MLSECRNGKNPALNKAINNKRARRVDGTAGIETPFVRPQATNWALALVADLRVCCVAMLTNANNFVRFETLAFHVSGLHVQFVAQSQSSTSGNAESACK